MNAATKVRMPRPVIETASLDFFAGILGLSSEPNDGGRPKSLLSELAAGESPIIPSISFSYTARSFKSMYILSSAVFTHAERRIERSKGSLVLGGYDTSRIKVGTTIQGSLPSGSNDSVPINVEAIYVNSTWSPGSSFSWSLPSSGPAVFNIDAALPHLWLPLEARAMFEKAFNLTWDFDLELYLIDEHVKGQFIDENLSVSFLLGSQPGVPSKWISLSYASFNLWISPPIVEKNMSYFPIRRATDPRQYLLGRTFLQETYLTVDYKHSTYTLSAAEDYPIPDGAILPILQKAKPGAPSGNRTQVKMQPKLSGGAYAGIAIGATALFLLVVGCTFLYWRRRSRRTYDADALQSKLDGSELQADDKEVPLSMVPGCMELPDKEIVEGMGREPGELATMQRESLKPRNAITK